MKRFAIKRLRESSVAVPIRTINIQQQKFHVLVSTQTVKNQYKKNIPPNQSHPHQLFCLLPSIMAHASSRPRGRPKKVKISDVQDQVPIGIDDTLDDVEEINFEANS